LSDGGVANNVKVLLKVSTHGRVGVSFPSNPAMWLPMSLNLPLPIIACVAFVAPPRSMRLLRKMEVSLPWLVSVTGWAQPVMVLS
jgi:hypothetical protein